MASLPLDHKDHIAWPQAAEPCAMAEGLTLCGWREFTSAEAIAEWDELALEASEPNPFYESWSLLPALANLDRAHDVQLAMLRQNGKLLGLMPLARARNYYRYPLPNLHNWLHYNAFCGTPLVAKGAESSFWTALLTHADTAPGGAIFLHLTHLSEDGPLTASLRDLAQEQDRPWGIVHREARALLQSDESPQAYFENSMSGKKRKELRRQHNRLAELGSLRFERHLGEHGINQWCEDFLKLEQSGWKGREGSALACDPANAAIFRTSLNGAATRGRLERLSLSLDGRPIAMLVNFLTSPGSFSFKTAFDEEYARFSPGVLIQRENLDLLDRPAIDWCDSCAAADHPMIERIWRQKRSIIRANIGIGGALRRSVSRQIIRAEAGRISEKD